MLFEVFQPHIRIGAAVIIEHVVLHDLDSLLVPGMSINISIVLYCACYFASQLFISDLGHDDIIDLYHMLDPLFVYPDASLIPLLGPEDIHRTVSIF